MSLCGSREPLFKFALLELIGMIIPTNNSITYIEGALFQFEGVCTLRGS